MLGGLYGDLPQAKAKDEPGASSQPEAWSVQLPPARRPPAFGGAPYSVLKAANRPKEGLSRQPGKPIAGRAGAALLNLCWIEVIYGGQGLEDVYLPSKLS